jgi:hypothetical protein
MNGMIKDKAKEEANKIKDKVVQEKKHIEQKLGLKEDMTFEQKAGKVTEKAVGAIKKGIDFIGQKMEETNAKRYAAVQDLMFEDKIIGKNRNEAVTITRAEACKAFVAVIRQHTEEIYKTIAEDAIESACVDYDELREFYLNTKVPITQAEIEFNKKKLDEVTKNGTSD